MGGGDLNTIKTMIPSHLLTKIRNIQLNGSREEDKIVWKGSKGGIISSKSFFQFLSKEDDEQPDFNWNIIWKLDCPQKLRFFMWLVVHGRLPTNEYRVKIGIEGVEDCNICLLAIDSLDHLLRTCPKSQQVWSNIIPLSKMNWFMNAPFKEWINDNLKDKKKIWLGFKHGLGFIFCVYNVAYLDN